jgi:hypothetical protein
MRVTVPVVAIGLLACVLTSAPARAQHVHPSPAPEPSPSPAAPAAHVHTMSMPMGDETPSSPTLFQSDMSAMTGMTAAFAPHAAGPGWTRMAMGLARLQWNRQGGPSGDTAVESSNWNMLMAQRPVAAGTLTLMMMNSLEPATFGGGGMPQIFQTGEVFEGRPLVDRQHPHDLFMNLSATWRRPVGAGAGWIQLAPVGEPALGPTAFMHRASSGENLTAPLGHHWHDSSHITSTVITAGGAWRRAVLEASAFHGKEPDEGRWDIDAGALDSYAVRLKVGLGGPWSAQVSHGFLKDPETLSPGNARRTTASLHYRADGDGPIAASLVWGQNREVHGVSNAALAEGAWQMTARDQVYARAEYGQKDEQLLVNKGVSEREQHGHSHGFTAVVRPSVPVGAMTVGYLRNRDLFGSVNAGLGADITVYQVGASLREAYGDMPVSTHAFVRVRWGRPHTMHTPMSGAPPHHH